MTTVMVKVVFSHIRLASKAIAFGYEKHIVFIAKPLIWQRWYTGQVCAIRGQSKHTGFQFLYEISRYPLKNGLHQFACCAGPAEFYWKLPMCELNACRISAMKMPGQKGAGAAGDSVGLI